MQENGPLDSSCIQGLTTRIIGSVINFYGNVSSTNELALELARAGCEEGTVVVASSQSGAKDRSGRLLSSPDGGLYLSTVLKPNVEPSEVSALPLILGLAVSKTIQCTTLLGAEPVWPGDVTMNGKRVCHITIEHISKGRNLDLIIAGIGMNVNNLVSGPSEEARTSTSLRAEIGRTLDLAEVLRDLLYSLDLLYSRFLFGQTASILDEWTERATLKGKDVVVETVQVRSAGKALGIDSSGALIISEKGVLRRIVPEDCLRVL